ncbi:radical SAM protein, partial [Haemophilus parainfluenzae]|uniref:radical SAM protein n=1 Tax=Haemophilus parainfluenzae TaxID=729 RepID=UPI001CEC3869
MGINPDAEISMEMDPGTFDLEHLAGFMAAGINRISLGVQAFDDDILAACGRSHRLADIEQTVAWLRQLQVAN